MTKLLKERELLAIKDMRPGQERWTVPWAMFADHWGELWLRVNYPAYEQPSGTVAMRVTRGKDDLYHIDASVCRSYRQSTTSYIAIESEPIASVTW